MSDDFKNLHLERENIEQLVAGFADENNFIVRSITSSGVNKKRAILGAVGIEDSITDLFLNKDGTTTVSWKVGKNQGLGEQLSIYLKKSIDPDKLSSVNFSVKGITSDDFEPVLDELSQCVDENGKCEFNIEIKSDDSIKKCIKISSNQHDDNIVITHFKTTKKLTIQGKTLFTYRRAIYHLSELLDLNGLQSVLSCVDTESASIVRNEVAVDYLKGKLPNSYDALPSTVRSLMLSGCCVKLASPSLPEYSMLLFPDLRALEGVLRTILSEYDLNVSEEEHGFGGFFTVRQNSVTLKQESSEVIANSNLISPLESAYKFYRIHRHTLFHMQDFADSSRIVDTLDKAVSLSNDTYEIIEKIFIAKNT